ncbi:MAG: hypothetical protein L6Q98_25375, partial [Anaerolineae bacterium]|nr:hypothetical protein [Anaerolineae bacterium]
SLPTYPVTCIFNELPMICLLALVRFRCSSTLCRFLTGQEQAITPTITQRALPDCDEGAAKLRLAQARSNQVKRSP